MRGQNNFNLLFLCFVIAVAPSASFSEDGETRNILNREATQGWSRLRAATNGLSITYKETIESLTSNKTFSKKVISHSFCIRDRYAKNTRHREDMPDLEDVEVENPEYTFRASSPSHSRGYSMSLYDASTSDGVGLDEEDSRFNLGYLISGYYIEPYNCFEILENAEFECVSSRTLDSGKFEVEFKWSPRLIPDGTSWLITFSPEQNWAINRANIQHPQGDTYIEVSYQETEMGGLVPKRVVEEHTQHGNRKAVVAKKTIEFGTPGKCEEPAEEFYAAAYGLPEPWSGFSSYSVWMLIFAFVFIITFWMFKRKAA